MEIILLFVVLFAIFAWWADSRQARAHANPARETPSGLSRPPGVFFYLGADEEAARRAPSFSREMAGLPGGLAQIESALRAGIPVLVWGPPGVGKTAAILSLGRRLGLPVEVVIASIREPTDFSGLPTIRPGGVTFEPPSWARRLAEAGRGILFLDELSTTPPAVQAALLRVVFERTVGDLPLPREVSIIAAANPPEQASGGWDLTPPLANRFCHIPWKLEPAEWAAEFPGYWEGPPGIPGLDPLIWARSRALVAGFIRSRPDLLLQVPKDLEHQGRAWPSPRSWDHASRAVAAVFQAGGGIEDAADLVIGCVGEGAGLEFIAWARETDLPDPEGLLAAPESFVLPERGDRRFAVLSAVAAAAAANLTKERWSAAWQILGRAAEAGAADVAATAARTLAQARSRRPDLPLPREIGTFVPLLREAGLLLGGTR